MLLCDKLFSRVFVGVSPAFGVRMGLESLQARFYIDPATGPPHVHNHQIEEHEVMDVLEKPGEDRAGSEGSRIALGQTASGRYLRVIYVPEPDSLFVITAYDLIGDPSRLIADAERRNINEPEQVSGWMG